MNELALFAGAGGGILGAKLLGWRTVCAVEFDAYARHALMSRQDDGCLPPFPVWDDVRTFDGRPWVGRVDVISGGFPCQDISAAGKGEGIKGARSGLWGHMARIVREVGPRFVFVENSPMLTSRGLGRVLGDLASMGYDARWCVLGAVDAGAPHRRDRIWILAHSNRLRELQPEGREQEQRRRSGDCRQEMADADSQRLEEQWFSVAATENHATTERSGYDVPHTERNGRSEMVEPDAGGAGSEGSTGQTLSPVGSWWDAEPDVGRVADGVASRLDRLRCLGNGQVPAVAALAWKTLGGT